MISAWDVYLVMQLDSIRVVFFVFAILLGGAVVIMIPLGGMMGEAVHQKLRWVIPVFVLTSILSVLVPSSKTAAAMLLVPALTSPQVTEPLTAEARELYGIAKQAIAQLAEKKAPEKEASK